VLEFRDENHYEVFNTSTERIGLGAFSITPGQTVRCTFELDLHLAQGTFRLAVSLFRYDVGKVYDRMFPAATAFVHCDRDVRGAVNLHPRAALLADNGAARHALPVPVAGRP
jgi:hypothetical protein